MDENRVYGKVNQQFMAQPDFLDAPARMNRRGEFVMENFIQQCIAEGKAFSVSNAAQETAEALVGTSYVNTTPAFLLDVPSGKSVLPIEILLKQAGTVAGGFITVIICVDRKVRRASAGTAITPINMNLGSARTPSSVFYTAPTATANTDDNTIYACLLTAAVDSPVPAQCVHLTNRDIYFPWLHGPASLAIHSFAGTTAPSWFYKVSWLELDSTMVE